jgi:hypothetical protein
VVWHCFFPDVRATTLALAKGEVVRRSRYQYQ